MDKQYLGDSVYVEHDGYGLWLTTENGYPDDPRNKIYLEPAVYQTLVDYVAWLRHKENEAKAREHEEKNSTD